MTTPEGTAKDPVAAVAADLAALRTEAAATYGELVQRIDELEAALTEHEPRSPKAPYWLDIEEEEYKQQIADLTDWVDTILLGQYPDYCEWLRPCWLNHREAIWELSTLRAAWRLAYDRKSPNLADAICWHDRLLPGVANRLEPRLAPCRGAAGCEHTINRRRQAK